MIKLREIYYKKYRNKNFSFFINKKEYSYQVINVTFKYSNKLYNQVNKDTFVMFGYKYSDLRMKDCICVINGQVVAVETNQPVKNPIDEDLLGKYFKYEDGVYKLSTTPPTLNSGANLRELLYKNGFYCNGIHYVRMKRSSGSARVGKCLFINEALYKQMHKWEMCGLNVECGQEIDLAALESYISLPTSSIIDTLKINPENILVIDDYESVFKDEVIAVRDNGGYLKANQEVVEVCNSIWDGQGLLDVSVFENYADKGMLLLRNLFFKCCCFNTNIQKWFKDNNITQVSQLNGFTLAKDIKDVKLITTPSSIKYLKFGSLEEWLRCIDDTFGIVKYDKKTHYFDGTMVQTHYQLINTLQMDKDDVKAFLKPSLDFAQQLQSDPAVLKYFIKYPENREISDSPMSDKNSLVYNLMNVNKDFTNTKYYYEFTNDLVRAFYKNLKRGHVYVNGNYSTMLGNPIEMLQSSIGCFYGESQIGIGNIHSTRFEYNKVLLGSRSPHVTMANVWLPINKENKLIDCYFNLTEEIVCVNSINENVLNRLSGAD